MRIHVLLISVCLVAICRTVCAEIPPLYSIECTSTDAATLTVHKDGYEFSSTDKTCTPTLSANPHHTVYQLDSNCFPNKTFTLKAKTTQGPYMVTEDINAFQLQCLPGGDGVYKVSVALAVVDRNAEPTIETVTFNSNDRLKLVLMHRQPVMSDDSTSLMAQSLTTAALGEALFLTIIDTYATDTLIIPLKCTDQAAGSFAETLWNLKRENTKPSCFKENSVVTRLFTSGLTQDRKQYVYMGIHAFKLTGHEDAPITFSCEVRVCTSATEHVGSCMVDKAAFDACHTSPAPAPRRRREVDDTAAPHGRLHQVTTTLRVVNDVMAIGTGASATISYALPCLLLSLLASILM